MFRRKSYEIKQTFSCNEDWNKMTEVEKGRFCDHCQKKVLDVTRHSDERLYKLFKESEGQLCVRISEKQLNKEIHQPSLFKIPWNKKFLTLPAIITALAGLLKTKSIHAQQAIERPRLHIENMDRLFPDTLEKYIEISGLLTDEENHKGLPFGNIEVLKNGRQIGAATSEFNGEYSVRINEKEAGDMEIKIHYVGYETVSRYLTIANSTKNIDFNLNLNSTQPEGHGIRVGGAALLPVVPEERKRSKKRNNICPAPDYTNKDDE